MKALILTRRNTIKVGIALVTFINLLVLLLLYFESGSSQASIIDIPSAYLYSGITIFTGGYGEVFPVTFYGRIIGFILVFFHRFFVLLVISFCIYKVRDRFRKRIKH
ncbi:MAG: ion channel [Marinoscillum sp.]